MKIYISDKENIDLSKNCYLTFSTKDKETVDWNVLAQSLEQHEAEIRKPLEDEIVELNKFISRLTSEKEPETAREITERHHREIMLERKNKFLEEEVERLKKENKRLIKDNKLLDKTKYTAQQDDIDFFVKQERLNVIAELEEWVDRSYTINITFHEKDNNYEEYKTVDFAYLKQKLNEMKEEKFVD